MLLHLQTNSKIEVKDEPYFPVLVSRHYFQITKDVVQNYEKGTQKSTKIGTSGRVTSFLKVKNHILLNFYNSFTSYWP